MRRMVLVLLVLGLPAVAEAPATSIFPRPRPVQATAAADVALADVTTAPAPIPLAPPVASARPRARPDMVSAAPQTEAPAPPRARKGLFASLFGAPRARPQEGAAPSGNSVCGDPAIIGQRLERISSRTNGCGVEDPVQITSIAGIALSQAATVDCGTATALRRWVDEGLRPAYGRNQVVGLQVAAHYICRTRNNVRGARVSEHGSGKAIDISGLILADGSVLTVAANWNRTMRAAYRAACGIFGTTLGPGSDGYHEDHMHFDTASYRSGAYCR